MVPMWWQRCMQPDPPARTLGGVWNLGSFSLAPRADILISNGGLETTKLVSWSTDGATCTARLAVRRACSYVS
jgi:hypothetical protein